VKNELEKKARLLKNDTPKAQVGPEKKRPPVCQLAAQRQPKTASVNLRISSSDDDVTTDSSDDSLSESDEIWRKRRRGKCGQVEEGVKILEEELNVLPAPAEQLKSNNRFQGVEDGFAQYDDTHRKRQCTAAQSTTDQHSTCSSPQKRRCIAALEKTDEHISDDEHHVLPELLCPITLCLFEDPVIATDGHTYEKKAIENWLQTQQPPTSPLTNLPLISTVLLPNYAIKTQITSLRSQKRGCHPTSPSPELAGAFPSYLETKLTSLESTWTALNTEHELLFRETASDYTQQMEIAYQLKDLEATISAKKMLHNELELSIETKKKRANTILDEMTTVDRERKKLRVQVMQVVSQRFSTFVSTPM
jgi:hypothetical protein